MNKLTSKNVRQDPLFLRNAYEGHGKWGIPLVRKQNLPLDNIALIACADTKAKYSPKNKAKGVHFFVDDYRFNGIYVNPQKSLHKYSQYAFLLTPDYSTYVEMYPWRQLESIAHSRWCGAYWQSKGLLVIPTISWSTARCYEFCFDGIEKGSIVAIGMNGCKRNKKGFLLGYEAMLKRIEPEAIICFGDPFEEMTGNIITIDYRESRKGIR